jgi:hypothetical protein
MVKAAGVSEADRAAKYPSLEGLCQKSTREQYAIQIKDEHMPKYQDIEFTPRW